MNDILVSNNLVFNNNNYGPAIMTTNSSASHYGFPILRIGTQDDFDDFGPTDLLGDIHGNSPKVITAYEIIYDWANMEGRTEEELVAAHKFLSQFPR